MIKTKKTKILTVIAAVILAMCMAITAYAMWSSTLSVKGSVSAKGNWSLKVTDANIELSNVGADLDIDVPTYDVITYPIQIKYIDSNNNYIYNIDDTNPKTVSVSADEFAEYSEYVFITSASANFYVSGKDPNGRYSFKVKANENFNIYPVFPKKAEDGGAADGTIVGEAIAWACEGTLTPAEGEIVTLTYASARDYFAENPAESAVVISENGVEFAPVNFTLSGAWASYTVTVTNESSVNANLSDYSVVTSELGDIFKVSIPEGMENDILASGESCTFNVVVQLNAEGSFDAESAPFSIGLTYNQDAVNEAPVATHTH